MFGGGRFLIDAEADSKTKQNYIDLVAVGASASILSDTKTDGKTAFEQLKDWATTYHAAAPTKVASATGQQDIYRDMIERGVQEQKDDAFDVTLVTNIAPGSTPKVDKFNNPFAKITDVNISV